MTHEIPERLNTADGLLAARVREGRGDRPALLTDHGALTYREVQTLANRFGHLLKSAGVEPEQRVMIALPDGPEFVAALFGTLKIGAVVVMVNPELKPDAIAYLYDHTRARVVVAHRDTARAFRTAAGDARHLKTVLVLAEKAFAEQLAQAPATLDAFPTPRGDTAIWLLSALTTGCPKVLVQ